jgi:SAM-dependent methyltransferase
MDIATFEVEAEVEANHWWFVGRRQLFSSLIEHTGLDRRASVLDVGTSTGTNLRMLRDLGFSRVRGLDSSEVAIQFCDQKGLGTVELGDACRIPAEDGSFQLVLATDVIEHVDDDNAALKEFTRVLAPGGYLLLTVPAFMSLWGLQDTVAQHRRRYRMRGLVNQIADAGLQPLQRFYFNFFLFAPIWTARQIIKMFGIKLGSENQVNSPSINKILTRIMAFDVALAPSIRPPFGVSALVLARKA